MSDVRDIGPCGAPVEFRLECAGTGKTLLEVSNCRFDGAPDCDVLTLFDPPGERAGMSACMFVQTEGWRSMWEWLEGKLHPDPVTFGEFNYGGQWLSYSGQEIRMDSTGNMDMYFGEYGGSAAGISADEADALAHLLRVAAAESRKRQREFEERYTADEASE